MKKLSATLCAMILSVMGLSAASVSLGALVVADYGVLPDFEKVLASPLGQRSYEGFEWEITFDHVGLGGLYAAGFSKDAASNWWLDWYGVPLFVSYHLFGTHDFLDPFFEAGIGSGGRVFTSGGTTADPKLLISLFPALSGGLGLNLRPLVLGARLTWVPSSAEIPCTPIFAYPVGSAQLVFSLAFRIQPRTRHLEF